MALGSSTFSNIGGAVSDLFEASAIRTKGQGLRTEASEFQLAENLAYQNEAFTKNSTEIQQSQADLAIEKTIGGQQAAVAASGFAAGGSALDLLRDGASQGALHKAVLAQQGLITEAGYEKQARSNALQSEAANLAATAADHAAQGATTSAYIKFGAAAASLF
jgi:hypothetical protein